MTHRGPEPSVPGVPAGSRLVVGCMTGTSLDGLDVALVRIDGHGLSMRASVVRTADRPLGDMAAPLRALAEQKPATSGEIARLALRFGEIHAEAAASVLSRDRADLVAVHGQTVFHSPPASWQMVNPWPIASRIGCPVVSDLRGADLAAGGEGAPITPLSDWILFRGASQRAIINLGGFCNVTLLPAHTGAIGEIRGFDVCACNHVLDLAAQRGLACAFDEGGAGALRGVADAVAVEALRGSLSRQSGAGRSLGTGDEARLWVERWAGSLSGEDLAASAASGVAGAIAAVLPSGAEAVIAGGGARNAGLVKRLGEALGRGVRRTDDLGVPMQSREAACIAVLGALAMDRVPITLAEVTGHRGQVPRAGAWILPG